MLADFQSSYSNFSKFGWGAHHRFTCPFLTNYHGVHFVLVKNMVKKYRTHTCNYLGTAVHVVWSDTASASNDGVLGLDCDSHRAVGPIRTIRGVYMTQLNRLRRLALVSAPNEWSFYV